MIDGLTDVYFPIFTGHLDKAVDPVASKRACWRHLPDEIQDFKCYVDNVISPGMQSRTETLFDLFRVGHPDKRLFEPLEDIERMNSIWGNK